MDYLDIMLIYSMMTINLIRGEKFDEGWKRLIIEQCQLVLSHLKNRKNPYESIHETRKAFKKIRGLLRLVRNIFPAYREENIFFRDQGRVLSEIRDYQAVQDTLLRLYSTNERPAKRNTCKGIAKMLNRKRVTLEKQLLKKEKIFDQISQNIIQKLKEIEEWSLEEASFSHFLNNIKHVYKKGLRLYEIAKSTGEASDFHEWRKQSKYLRYQLEFLFPLWPNLMSCWENEMHTLTDYIGEEHDLIVLKQLMEAEDITIKNSKERLEFEETVTFHKEQCRSNALTLGAKCYSERPKFFRARVNGIWEAYQRELDEFSKENAP